MICDRDNDKFVEGNCVWFYMGVWWYNVCLLFNLNGVYFYELQILYVNGVNWKIWGGFQYFVF